MSEEPTEQNAIKENLNFDIPQLNDIELADEIDISDLIEEIPDITDEDLGLSSDDPISKEQRQEAKRKEDYSNRMNNSIILLKNLTDLLKI